MSRRAGPPPGPKVYRPGLMERLGPGSYEALRAVVWTFALAPITMMACLWHFDSLEWPPALTVLVSVGAGLLAWLVAAAGATLLGHGGGTGLGSTVWPSGKGTPFSQEFSLEMAHVARGDVAGALALLERRVAEKPRDAQARIAVADVYALHARDPGRARRHFEAVLLIPGAPVREARYAASRLADLYLGVLAAHPAAAHRVREIERLYPGLVPAGALPPEP